MQLEGSFASKESDDHEAWKREVNEWKIQMERCLLDLAHAIRSEDFEGAKQVGFLFPSCPAYDFR